MKTYIPTIDSVSIWYTTFQLNEETFLKLKVQADQVVHVLLQNNGKLIKQIVNNGNKVPNELLDKLYTQTATPTISDSLLDIEESQNQLQMTSNGVTFRSLSNDIGGVET